jgi:prepilin-type N-terminal cleavage/methylation domain-containing protein
MKTFFTSKRGFTLVEAMVAMSILSLAVTGPLLIAQKGIASAIYARDQVTAYYLAQEAVEYVRNVRDSNRITSTPWLSQFADCKVTAANPANRCKIDARIIDFNDTNNDPITPCSGTCPLLGIDGVNNTYGYGAGLTNSKFRRTISIDDRASPKEAEISVTISWMTNLFVPERAFTVKEYMFDF